MRMMTGAILILASSILLFMYTFLDKSLKVAVWVEWYGYITSFIGWAFIGWGIYKDILASRYRKHHRIKGDT
ncbi:MAG: hypothetical protein K8S55_08370 [Phycisphaerae bacterium]|nr:hypothetical protein [Phycisphaerae bacterium]